MMKSAAWTDRKDDNGTYGYSLQFSDIKGVRKAKRLIKELQAADWRLVSEGYSKGNVYFLIFRKDFKSQNAWVRWARSTDYPIVEYNNKNKKKAIKLGSFYTKKESE